jgi:hypothetical protein
VNRGMLANWLGKADLALWCQSRMEEGGIVPPHSVLAPETALRSVRTVALPSAPVTVHYKRVSRGGITALRIGG